MSWYYSCLPLKPHGRVWWRKEVLLLTGSQFAQILISYSAVQPADKAMLCIDKVLCRARSCYFSKASGKAWRGGHCLHVAAVEGFPVQLHTSSSVGGWRRSGDDLRVVRLESHALCFCVCQQRCISPGTHLTARQRWEHPAFSGYRFTSCGKDWGDKSALAQVSALTWASSPFLLHRKFCSYPRGHLIPSKMLFQSPLPGVLRLLDLFLVLICPSLQEALNWWYPGSITAAQWSKRDHQH